MNKTISASEIRGWLLGLLILLLIHASAFAQNQRTVTGTVSDETGEPLIGARSEEHTSELQSRQYLVCRLLLEKKNCSHTLISNLLSLHYIPSSTLSYLLYPIYLVTSSFGYCSQPTMR